MPCPGRTLVKPPARAQLAGVSAQPWDAARYRSAPHGTQCGTDRGEWSVRDRRARAARPVALGECEYGERAATGLGEADP
eukprot:7386176-Prymnesium_polylepis.3